MVFISLHLIKIKNTSLILVKKNFIILGSAHNVYEMRTKELQNVNAIFLSSIFKKNKNYLGINKFKSLSLLSNKPIIALGGISNNNIKKLNLTNCSGFAGISFFEEKKASKEGRIKFLPIDLPLSYAAYAV